MRPLKTASISDLPLKSCLLPFRYVEIRYRAVNKSVVKYRSPVLGRTMTICFPWFPGCLANSNAAQAAAPEDMPHKIPSEAASSLAVVNACSLVTVMISSMMAVFKTSGTKPAPIP